MNIIKKICQILIGAFLTTGLFVLIIALLNYFGTWNEYDPSNKWDKIILIANFWAGFILLVFVYFLWNKARFYSIGVIFGFLINTCLPLHTPNCFGLPFDPRQRDAAYYSTYNAIDYDEAKEVDHLNK